jgi:MoxR-like ATPase
MSTLDARALSAPEPDPRLIEESRMLGEVTQELGKVIVGQHAMVERLLIGLLADGHVLLEGVPGLAKTLAVRTLASTVAGGFHRIQFTPDLLPSDLIGTMVYNQRSGEFTVQKGPIFTNILLADEINRAPAKVQSALLEAMQEKQVTRGLPGAGDPESDRARGHVSAAGGPGRPVHVQADRYLPGAPGRA